MIQIVKIEDAIGYPLAHDITEIRPGEFKGPAFNKGHILSCRDLDHLRRLGKDHLYIIKPEINEMHEDEAAYRLASALCGEGVVWKDKPLEGKLLLLAEYDGLFKVDSEYLNRFNSIGEVMCATRHTNTVVKKGQNVAATRAIPLLIDRNIVENAFAIASHSPNAILRVLPLKKAGVGVIITGNEVYHGRIADKFEPIIRNKVLQLGGTITDVVLLPDDDIRIAEAAVKLADKNVDVIITTGGMSVDPDDRTRFALYKAGAQNMVYGSPVLPGAMFMIAYLKQIPVLGIPACGLFAATTVFDLIYPRILAGEIITRNEIAALGHGGLCLNCAKCRYPNCPFGH